ncbi:hypothetical protein ONR75_10365 [Rhodopseudomonas sp. P2A-2r]|uniref:hypothetical protein n=1 Tax=Rhodopseudomonas sp. P2A-2r TaxID=2991972 RepID=UPI002234BCB5|nr:hypothetical protein [Rhodopseudomonas sp. P2A-2r]UZE52424.1 hypothetical protein ONR75_10365 [Rhodopseudomonas sp. P2A-2r]
MAVMDLQEQVTRIELMQEETRKSLAEQQKASRDAVPSWQLAIGGMSAGAALFGAGAAF